MPQITYSFVICTYNRASYLKETIESVLLHFKGRTNFELLVIDNNSPDHTVEVVQGFAHVPVVKYFLETNQGLSHARNRGMKEALNDVLIFVDDDIDIENNYLAICDELYSDPAIDIVGGKVLPFKKHVPDWLPQQFYFIVSIFDVGDNSRFVEKLMGANYSMRREVVQQVGLYNPELGRKGNSLMGGEENDYLARAQALGYKVLYDPRLVVYHKIENKLNKKYVYDYAPNIGSNEAFIDAQNNKAKLYLKSIKSVLRVVAYYVFGFYAPSHKQRVYFKINKLHGLGYLKVFLKNL